MNYYESLMQCSLRYNAMVLDNHWDVKQSVDSEFKEFLTLFQDGVRDQLPLMKLNRWLGYIQGTLITLGYTTVEAERDWTRPLFRPLDFSL